MRLLVVNVFFEPTSFGGATVVAEHMAQNLCSRGFDVTALSARFSPLPAVSVFRYKTKFGFDAFSVGLSPAPTNEDRQRYANPLFDDAFRQVLAFVNPDIVHIHCVQELGASFFDVLVEADVPFVVTVHDFWWLCATQFMIDDTGDYCNQRTISYEKCEHCVGKRKWVEERAEYLKQQLAKANLILTPSNFARDILIENGFASQQVLVNKNGVLPPSKNYRPRSVAKNEGVINFGYIGGPGLIKGWDLILDAFSTLPKEKFRLLTADAGALVGQSWKQDFERHEKRLPIEIIPGYGSNDIDQVFSKFDVLLCPSRWKETFGLAVREALLRGVWVIASDAGGLAEDIVDGKNGRILPFPPSVEVLRAALVEVLDRQLPKRIKKSNITTIEVQASQLADLLEAIVTEIR